MLHVLKYTDRLPEGRGGDARAFFIRLRPKYRSDTGILAHELTHVGQWWAGALIGVAIACLAAAWFGWWPYLLALGPLLHPGAYWLSPRYRLWAEVQAYRRQLKHYPDDRTALFASMLADPERYHLGISAEDAVAALNGRK